MKPSLRQNLNVSSEKGDGRAPIVTETETRADSDPERTVLTVRSKRRTALIYMLPAFSGVALASRLVTIPLDGYHLGASNIEIGLLFSAWVLPAGAASLPAGALIDRIGPRNMLLGSLLLACASQFVAGLSANIPMLFLAQISGGLASAGSQTALLVALVGSTPATGRGRAMGWFTLAQQSGTLAGPALAGVLLRWFTLPQVFLLGAAPIAVATFMALASIGGGRTRQHAKGRSVAVFLAVARRVGFGPLVVAFLALSILWGTFQSYVAIFATRGAAMTGPEIGYMFAFATAAGAAARIPGGYLIDKIQGRELILVATCASLAAGAIAILPHMTDFVHVSYVAVLIVPVVSVGQMAAGVGFLGMGPIASRGTTAGIYTMLTSLGYGIGAVTFGPFMNLNYGLGFTSCCVAVVVLSVAALLFARLRVGSGAAQGLAP